MKIRIKIYFSNFNTRLYRTNVKLCINYYTYKNQLCTQQTLLNDIFSNVVYYFEIKLEVKGLFYV